MEVAGYLIIQSSNSSFSFSASYVEIKNKKIRWLMQLLACNVIFTLFFSDVSCLTIFDEDIRSAASFFNISVTRSYA